MTLKTRNIGDVMTLWSERSIHRCTQSVLVHLAFSNPERCTERQQKSPHWFFWLYWSSRLWKFPKICLSRPLCLWNQWADWTTVTTQQKNKRFLAKWETVVVPRTQINSEYHECFVPVFPRERAATEWASSPLTLCRGSGRERECGGSSRGFLVVEGEVTWQWRSLRWVLSCCFIQAVLPFFSLHILLWCHQCWWMSY